MKYLIVRLGAIGDCIITTPLVRYLKNKGHEVYYFGSERAKMILENNPNIDQFILYPPDSVENTELGNHFDFIGKVYNCDKVVNLCESIEVRLAVTQDYPQWNWPKRERREYCDKNYYEYTFEHAGFKDAIKEESISPHEFYRPEMFFTQEEEDYIEEFRKKWLGYKIIMWGLSGSGRHKTYPYVPYVVGDLLKNFKDIVVFLVGGNTCKILECGFPNHKRIEKLSGIFNFRQSALMAKYAYAVVSPDTGFLHSAGCWDTPKIGLLTHSTIKNITGNFINDYSIESEAVCAPCFRLVTENDNCLLEKGTKSCLCMSAEGMKPERVYKRITEVINANRGVEVSCVS